jgi:NADPH2:quinone reductase
MNEQGLILNKASAFVDAGMLHTALTERLSPINAADPRQVHVPIGSRKIVLEGFEANASARPTDRPGAPWLRRRKPMFQYLD